MRTPSTTGSPATSHCPRGKARHAQDRPRPLRGRAPAQTARVGAIETPRVEGCLHESDRMGCTADMRDPAPCVAAAVGLWNANATLPFTAACLSLFESGAALFFYAAPPWMSAVPRLAEREGAVCDSSCAHTTAMLCSQVSQALWQGSFWPSVHPLSRAVGGRLGLSIMQVEVYVARRSFTSALSPSAPQ